MTAILILFFSHWVASIFAQTFFLHRYAAHAMVTMSKFWEKFFYIFTIVAQGPSFLHPYGYAVLHRMHHIHSDTEDDPHSPLNSKDIFSMMWKTKHTYDNYAYRKVEPEAQFTRDYIPSWNFIDKLSQSWYYRVGTGTLYALYYMYFVPEGMWYLYLLLPIHWIMGPIHGAIVNWGGHKYGYVNHNTTGDNSKNSLPIDFLTMGELMQNNHHGNPQSINFAYHRWYEVDLAYQVIRLLDLLRTVKIQPPEKVPELKHPDKLELETAA